VHKWHPGQQWIWDAGGFGVFDPGINAFSVATAILPGPLFVRSADLTIPANAQNPIAAEILFDSPAAANADARLRCSLDFAKTDGEEWTIRVRTASGEAIELREGGKRLFVDGQEQAAQGPGEYPDLYAKFVDLIDCRQSLVDVEPLRLVADTLLVGNRKMTDPITM
jgi:predicted dehydrogenase